jgi:hypothetical protein
MHDVTEVAINWVLVLELRDLPSTELKYDTFNRLLMVTFGSTVHDFSNVMSVVLEQIFFGREQVVLFGGSSQVVIDTKALLVIEQDSWKKLFVERSGQALGDFIVHVGLAVGSAIAQADVNNVSRHGRTIGFTTTVGTSEFYSLAW